MRWEEIDGGGGEEMGEGGRSRGNWRLDRMRGDGRGLTRGKREDRVWGKEWRMWGRGKNARTHNRIKGGRRR